MSSGRVDRRDFLRHGAALAAVATTAPLLGGKALADTIEGAPRIQRYVPLGRTKLEISDISFGSSQMFDADVVRYAFDRGINYFDTAEGYMGGASETAIGEALAGKRDKVLLASKTS